MDCSLPGSSVHGVFQARVLEWGAIALSVLLFRPPKKKSLGQDDFTGLPSEIIKKEIKEGIDQHRFYTISFRKQKQREYFSTHFVIPALS